ncbi:hypothetical protein [Sulfurimonas sp.]
MSKAIVAQTFTPTYCAIEDRVILVINYGSVDNRVEFMITRRFIIELLCASEEFYFKYCQESVNDEVHISLTSEANVAQNNIQKREEEQIVDKTDVVNLQLLKKDALLLKEVNFSYNKENKQISLIFSADEIKTVAQLDCVTFQTVFKHIKKAIPYIEWGISHHF